MSALWSVPIRAAAALLLVVVLSASEATPQETKAPGKGSLPADPKVRAAVDRAVSLLRARALRGGNRTGESALMALALLKAGVPANDPAVAGLLTQIRRQIREYRYVPDREGGPDNYEAALVGMALAASDPERYREEIVATAHYLVQKQTPSGAWDYRDGTTGDTSMTQYGLLGLWTAAEIGFEVPPAVWDQAADWLVTRQDPTGGFAYHPLPPVGSELRPQGELRHSMTAGALGSLYLCRDRLPSRRRPAAPSPLVAVESPSSADYQPRTSAAAIDRAIQRGADWMGKNFTIAKPIGPLHYYVYSLERYAAFSGKDRIGSQDWYQEGARHLTTSQTANGAWIGHLSGEGDEVVATSFAVLFLVRSMHQTLERRVPRAVARFGAGSLLGGRGLPADLSQMVVRDGRLVALPMKGSIEELLRALETDADQTEGAIAGIQQAAQREGTVSLARQEAQLVKLARDPRPEVRKAALWSLGRTGHYEVAPILIAALRDREPAVMRQARDALCSLSRKPEGFGPSDNPSNEEIEAAIEKWQAWYRSVRPYDVLEGR